MNKKIATAFVLGFITAYAIPVSRAVIVGFHMGVTQAREDQKTAEKIVSYHKMHSVN